MPSYHIVLIICWSLVNKLSLTNWTHVLVLVSLEPCSLFLCFLSIKGQFS